MKLRLSQLIARYLACGLVALLARWGVDAAAEQDELTSGLALALGAVGCVLWDHVAHRLAGNDANRSSVSR